MDAAARWPWPARATTSPWATEDQYRLFRAYLDSRHADGGMADMDAFDYASMVDETPVNSTVIEYSVADAETGSPRLGMGLNIGAQLH